MSKEFIQIGQTKWDVAVITTCDFLGNKGFEVSGYCPIQGENSAKEPFSLFHPIKRTAVEKARKYLEYWTRKQEKLGS